ncbi:MAG: hypothetical protein IT385_21450 [Deltaproteobacteria bacterium]|nr:hypothetical protein [Deltaproteobacteria bacterium]
MPAQVGDVVSAYCSQCKDNIDVDVVSVAGAEIVTVTCKTCGTSQRFRPPMDKAERARAVGRRVVDVGSGGSASEQARPRGRATARRVLSPTGREIVDDPMPRRVAPTTPQPMPVPMPVPAAPVPRPAGMSGMSNDDLFRRWAALTHNLMSRHGRPHRASESYRTGEIILSSVHGMGIVEQVADDGTLTALFKRGYQQLPSTPRPESPAAAGAKG